MWKAALGSCWEGLCVCVCVYIYLCSHMYMIYIWYCNGLQWEVSLFSVPLGLAIKQEHLAGLGWCSAIETASLQAQGTMVLEQTWDFRDIFNLCFPCIHSQFYLIPVCFIPASFLSLHMQQPWRVIVIYVMYTVLQAMWKVFIWWIGFTATLLFLLFHVAPWPLFSAIHKLWPPQANLPFRR